jgi:hypothetical protein
MDIFNNNPITAIQNLPALTEFKGSITEQVKASAELTKFFFRMPYDQTNEVVHPLLCEAANHFTKNGISRENLPAALITFLALHSVRLGYPLPIILQSDDPQPIYHLLNICKQIAPNGTFMEVQELSWEQLYENPDKFRGKAIICTNAKGCKKAMPDIQDLILSGKSARQVPYKNSMGKSFERHHIKYPVGFIGVETADEKNILDHPAILKIPLSSNEGSASYAVSSYDAFEQPSEKDSRETHGIQKIFGRLRPCKVQVSFKDQISSDLLRQKPNDLLIKLNSVQIILSLLSIINNPSLITPEELLDGFIGVNSSKPHPIKTIEATKVEYAIMALLLKGVLPIKEKQFTPVQIIIFEAVKAINIGKLTASTVDKEDKIQVLSILYKGSAYWAKSVEIFEKANRKGGKLIPMQVIDRELNKLDKLGIITKKKFPLSSDFGYFINDTSIGGHITFQNPSEINDPKFNMAPVKVMNPLTGNIETI